MNTKLTKIRNISLDVCCAEQVIAYNICNRYASLYSNKPRISWNLGLIKDAIYQINSNVNKDMLQHFVMFNFEKYVKNGSKIYSSYDEIGLMFTNGYIN